MNTITIIDIILTAIIIVVVIINAYRKMGTTIRSKATFLIAEAAELDMIGKEKMKIVVENLYRYVPKIFRRFMTKEKLEEIAQSIYDDMKLFTENDLKDSVYKEEL